MSARPRRRRAPRSAHADATNVFYLPSPTTDATTTPNESNFVPSDPTAEDTPPIPSAPRNRDLWWLILTSLVLAALMAFISFSELLLRT